MTIHPPHSEAYLEIFKNWLLEAEKSEPNDPMAACLGTADTNGMPNARMILIRIIDERGFAFFTNYNSRKGQELLANPKAALCFHWKTLRKQVRIQGNVEKTSDAEADAYYNSRARESRIGAWASLQSETLHERDVLLESYAAYEKKFGELTEPPRPLHWSGFRIVPEKIEFWQDGDHRLHQREVYEKTVQGWTSRLLYP